MSSSPIIYGIRHHGPGCARSLATALANQCPDIILVESPEETTKLFEAVGDEGMKPPVAMVVYQADAPEHSGFYPFARFSPEWQTALYAAKNEVPIRAFDLPSAHAFALRQEDDEEESPEETLGDPFDWFARADGYTDGERWWNDKLEERTNSTDFFASILEAITALRGDLARNESKETLLREAWMRRQIRKAQKDGFQNIAVVCGAWHAPRWQRCRPLPPTTPYSKAFPR